MTPWTQCRLQVAALLYLSARLWLTWMSACCSWVARQVLPLVIAHGSRSTSYLGNARDSRIHDALVQELRPAGNLQPVGDGSQQSGRRSDVLAALGNFAACSIDLIVRLAVPRDRVPDHQRLILAGGGLFIRKFSYQPVLAPRRGFVLLSSGRHARC